MAERKKAPLRADPKALDTTDAELKLLYSTRQPVTVPKTETKDEKKAREKKTKEEDKECLRQAKLQDKEDKLNNDPVLKMKSRKREVEETATPKELEAMAKLQTLEEEPKRSILAVVGGLLGFGRAKTPTRERPKTPEAPRSPSPSGVKKPRKSICVKVC